MPDLAGYTGIFPHLFALRMVQDIEIEEPFLRANVEHSLALIRIRTQKLGHGESL